MTITINADDLRTIRALEIAAQADEWLACAAPDGSGAAYLIRSQSDPERRYLVTSGTCECPDFQRSTAPSEAPVEARPCKHILAVRLYHELVRAQRYLKLPPRQRRADS